jgi:hypothetical protein
VILEGQGLFLVVHQDMVQIGGLGHEGAGLDLRQPLFQKVVTDPVAQALSLADVDNGATGVPVQVDAWGEREGVGLVAEAVEEVAAIGSVRQILTCRGWRSAVLSG